MTLRATSLAALLALPGRAAASTSTDGDASDQCAGEYADFLSALSPANAEFEKSPAANYSYCVRTTATYEHVYYGKGGKLRKRYIRTTLHGTAFAYRQKEGEYWLATNDHVANLPEVTDEDHEVDGVPIGARKVKETLKIVKDENDDYEPGHVPLSRAVTDVPFDLALLKTRTPLTVMPYRFGRSSALRTGNVVLIRGFPLGVFPASNTGKVINPAQVDVEKGWQHRDFVIDAPLNQGSSGSPVFAINCKTKELELVGVFHANYKRAQGLSVVIDIDQLKEMLETGKAPKRDPLTLARIGSDPLERGDARERLKAQGGVTLFPFADRTVRASLVSPSGIRFALLDDGFPLEDREDLVVAFDDEHDELATLRLPWRPDAVLLARLEEEPRDQLLRLGDGMWRQLGSVLRYRELRQRADAGGEVATLAAAAREKLRSSVGEQRELLQAADYALDGIALPPVRAGDPPPTVRMPNN